MDTPAKVCLICMFFLQAVGTKLVLPTFCLELKKEAKPVTFITHIFKVVLVTYFIGLLGPVTTVIIYVNPFVLISCFLNS